MSAEPLSIDALTALSEISALGFALFFSWLIFSWVKRRDAQQPELLQAVHNLAHSVSEALHHMQNITVRVVDALHANSSAIRNFSQSLERHTEMVERNVEALQTLRESVHSDTLELFMLVEETRSRVMDLSKSAKTEAEEEGAVL